MGPQGDLVIVRLSPWYAAPSATTSSLRVTVSSRFIPEGFATMIDDDAVVVCCLLFVDNNNSNAVAADDDGDLV